VNKWLRLNNAIPTDQMVEIFSRVKIFFRVYGEYTAHTAILGRLLDFS
jgi:hypothetical protein